MRMTQDEYDALSPMEQFEILSKFMATLDADHPLLADSDAILEESEEFMRYMNW